MKPLLKATLFSGITLLAAPQSSSENQAAVPLMLASETPEQVDQSGSELFTKILPEQIRDIIDTFRDSSLSDLIPDQAILDTIEALRREHGTIDFEGLTENIFLGQEVFYLAPSFLWQSRFCEPIAQANEDCNTAWYRYMNGTIFLNAGYDIETAVASAFFRLEADTDLLAYFASISFSAKNLFAEIRSRLEDPKALGDLYQAKKPVLLKALSQYDPYNLGRIRSWLQNLEEKVLPALKTTEFLDSYNLHIDLGCRMQKEGNQISMDDRLDDTETYVQNVQLSDARARILRLLAYQTDDARSALFFMEMPEEMRKEWGEIIADLRQALPDIP